MTTVTSFLFIAFLSIGFGCQIQNENNKLLCASLDELHQVNSAKNVEKLHVVSSESNKIVVLNASAFENVQNVKEVYILNNNIQDIQLHTFDKLNLNIFSIIGNNIAKLNSIFGGLELQELVLTNNKITFIENGAFNMRKLKVLKLNNNKLTAFDTKLLLGEKPSLELLVLSKNNLKSISKDTFAGLKKLKHLYLNNNELQLLQNNCFQDLTSLKTLDISTNKILEISPKFFPLEGLRSLRKFYFHNNHLCFLHPEVYQKFRTVRRMSYGGNPWQCPCWELLDRWVTDHNVTRVCHEEFAAGQRPECIVTEFAPQECVYDKERLNEVPNLYLSETQEYQVVSGCVGDYD